MDDKRSSPTVETDAGGRRQVAVITSTRPRNAEAASVAGEDYFQVDRGPGGSRVTAMMQLLVSTSSGVGDERVFWGVFRQR